MLDDILGGLLGEALFGRIEHTRRREILLRLFFGLLGAALGLGGAVYMLTRDDPASPHMRLAMAALLAFFGLFWLFNVALMRRWRWPGILTLSSLVALIAARFVLGP
jgi:hypothetical protein